MAIVNFTGFETGDALEVQSLNGTCSIQSTIKRTGTYALRVNPTTTAVGSILLRGVNGTTGQVSDWAGGDVVCYSTFYFRWETLPASNNIIIFEALGAPYFWVQISPSGTLLLVDSVSGTLDTDSTVLAASTWYRIEVKLDPVNHLQEVRLNGTTVLNGTADDTGNNYSALQFGKTAATSGTVDFYFDDICVDTANWVGAGEARLAVPIGAGADSAWNDGTGTTFAEVDELPHDSDTSYVGTDLNGDNLNHTFNMQTHDTIGVGGTIHAVKAILAARTDDTSGTSNVSPRLVSGGTGYEITGGELLTTYTFRGLLYLTNPNGGGAWDETAFDTIEVGVAANTIAQTQRITGAYLGVWSAGAPTVNLDITLKQGATTIATWTDQVITGAIDDYELVLTEAEIAAITAPADDLTIEINGDLGGGATVRVYEVTLVVPVAVAGTVTPTTATLTLTTFAPTVLTPSLVTPGTASLTLTTFAPTVLTPSLVTPVTATLTLTTFAPTVATPRLVTPTTATLTLTGFAPTVTATAHTTVTPATASLVLTGYAPGVSVTAGTALVPAATSLALTGFAPTVTTTAHVTVTPSTASLTLTGYAPTVLTPVLVTPSTASLTLTTFAPTVTTTAHVTVTPSTSSLVLTTFAPTVTATAHVTVTPTTASLVLTTFAPTVTLTAHVTVTPTTASLVLTTYAPTVSTPQTVTPAKASLTLTTFAPTVFLHKLVEPTTASLVLTTFAPTITTTAHLTVTPLTATLVLLTYAPEVAVAFVGFFSHGAAYGIPALTREIPAFDRAGVPAFNRHVPAFDRAGVPIIHRQI